MRNHGDRVKGQSGPTVRDEIIPLPKTANVHRTITAHAIIIGSTAVTRRGGNAAKFRCIQLEFRSERSKLIKLRSDLAEDLI